MDSKIDLDFDFNGVDDLSDLITKNLNAYKDIIYTKRLKLRKRPTPDCVSTVYSILLKDSEEEIGEVTLIYDGEIWYKVYKQFRKRGYATEAVSKLIEISDETEFYLSIDFFNRASKKVAKKLGFIYEERRGKNLIFTKSK